MPPRPGAGFCCETVPLLRMNKYTWTTDETFTGQVQVAHYGSADLLGARVTWTVAGNDGQQLAAGKFGPVAVRQGAVSEVDALTLPLARIAAPQRLMVTLAIEGTQYRNDYPIWVYPPKVDTAAPPGVLVSDSFTAAATQEHLAQGGKVLLLPKLEQLPHSVKGGFQTDFWSPMFAEAAQ